MNTFFFDTYEFRGDAIQVPGRSIAGVKNWIDTLDEAFRSLAAVTIRFGVYDPMEDRYTVSD